MSEEVATFKKVGVYPVHSPVRNQVPSYTAVLIMGAQRKIVKRPLTIAP